MLAPLAKRGSIWIPIVMKIAIFSTKQAHFKDLF